MAIVSDIEIRLLANVAELQQNMNEARRTVDSAMGGISRAAGIAKAGIAALAGVMSIGAFAGWIKGAIDATDVVSDLSQRTGVAIQDIAGLQLWFQKGGMEASSFESSMVKLAKNIGENGDEFAKLGIKTRDANGNLRASVDVMRDSADAFAGLEDGTAKTALAIQLFGKSGAELLPMLNEGSEGLREMNEMAERLGLTFSQSTVDAAGQFNDTIDFMGLATQGVGRQVAARLLPTLNSLAGTFLETATQGGMVTRVADMIAFSLKALYTVGVGIVTVFTTVGNTLGAAAAQVVAVLQGDFKTAISIGKQWQDDVKTGWAGAAKTISDAWTGAGGETVAAMAAQQKAMKQAQYETEKQAEAAKKRAAEAAAAAKQQESAYKSLITSIRDKIRESAAEAAGMGSLNDAQKMAAKLNADLADGTRVLTAAREAEVRAAIAQYAANLDAIEAQKEFKAMAEDLAKADAARQAENKKLIDSAREEAEAQENLVLTFGMTKSAIQQMEIARLEEQLAQKESNNLTWEEIDTLKQLIFYKKRSAEATASGEVLDQQKEESKKAADEQIKFWESIDKTAHDTFVSIMDGGKNAAQRLKDTFKNVFFDWLYQQTLKKWIINLSGTASLSATGAQAAGAAGGGGGGSGMIGSAVTTALGAYFGAGGVGGALAAGAGWVTGASTLGGSLAAGTSLIGTGTLAGGLSGATMLVGTIAPIAIAAVVGSALLKKAFGRGPKETTAQGIQGTFGADSFNGNSFTEWIKKGGWFRSDKKGMDTSALSKETADSLNAAYKTIKDNTTAFATALGQPTDTITGYTKAIKLALTGDATKDQKILADLFAEMGDELATRVLPNVADFIQQGETAATTLQRLAIEFQSVDAMLATLGLTSEKAFGAVGIASLEARDRLVRLAGGIEALGQQTTFFAENFMTEAERIAPVQKALNEQLSALGYAGLSTADQFKTAVLGIASSGELATEAGAKTYASLIALAPAFKAVTDYMDQAKAAAESLAQEQASIARATVATAFDALRQSIDARKASVTAAFQDVMASIEKAIDTTNGRIGNLTGLSGALRGANAAGQFGMMNRSAGQAQILAALAIAKASGVLPSADSLQAALQAVSQDAQNQFSTLADYQRDALLTQNSIEELAGITDTELSVARQQLAALEAQRMTAQAGYDQQIQRLDGMLASAQLQLNAINGVNVSILSLSAAMSSFQSAVASALKNPTVAAGPSAAEAEIESLYQSLLGRQSDAEGLAFWAQARRDGHSLASIEDQFKSSNEYRNNIYSPQQYGTMTAGASASGEMAALRATMEENTRYVRQFAEQFDSVSAGGQSLLTELT